MAKKKTISEYSLLRRSTRLLGANTAKETQVFISPISYSLKKTNLKSPLISSSVKNISCKQAYESSIRNSGKISTGDVKSKISNNGSKKLIKKSGDVEGIQGSRVSIRENEKNFVELSNGSEKLIRMRNGIEGFEGCRRSSRLSIVKCSTDISDKKNCGNLGSGLKKSEVKVNGGEGFVGCRRSPRLSIVKCSTEIVDKKCLSSSKELKRSIRKSNGVEGFEGCRRSPRLSILNYNTELLCQNSTRSNNASKTSTRMSNGIEGSQGSRRSPRISIMKNTPDIFDKKTDLKEVLSEGIRVGKSVKQGRQSLVVTGSRKFTKQDEMGFRSSQESARMAKGRKRVGSVVSPFSTPGKGKEKKKRNISCGTNDSCDMKENCGLREVNKSTSTEMHHPLTSLENISPKKTQLVCDGKSLKSLVEPKNEVSKCVKPISGSRKETEDRSTSSQSGEKCGAQGWTQDQESALQRAYFTANPSPHFWKKISKLVPGKSAQDCFDKFHSDIITPPQPQLRSRAKRTDLSPLGHFSLSASKLLEPVELNVKKSRGNKRTKCLAQKTVRHLLQKQNSVNQGYKADLFSILEPTAALFIHSAPVPETPSTPEFLLDKQSFRQNCTQRALLAHKKPLSRFRGTSKAPLESPAVLKQIKNLAFHEKYIDQLHSRDARRAAGGRRCTTIKEDTKENVQRMDVIKAAKNALVSDATDMINKFKHIEANALNNSEDVYDDDDYLGSDGQDGADDES